jgi:hypothetical protein
LYFELELENSTNFEEYFWILQKPIFIRFRFLDDNLKQEYFWKEIDDISIRVEDFEKMNFWCRDVWQKHLENENDISKDVALLHLYSDLKNIFITENEINYLTFPSPPLAPPFEGGVSIIIWWAGFKVNIFLKQNLFLWIKKFL